MIKRALGMLNRLKIQLTYVEQDRNIAFNCNNIQIYHKKALQMPNVLKIRLKYDIALNIKFRD